MSSCTGSVRARSLAYDNPQASCGGERASSSCSSRMQDGSCNRSTYDVSIVGRDASNAVLNHRESFDGRDAKYLPQAAVCCLERAATSRKREAPCSSAVAAAPTFEPSRKRAASTSPAREPHSRRRESHHHVVGCDGRKATNMLGSSGRDATINEDRSKPPADQAPPERESPVATDISCPEPCCRDDPSRGGTTE